MKPRHFAFAGIGLLVLLAAAYWISLAVFAPDESKLTAWRTDLDAALAEARTSGKLVLVKAGSKY